MSDSERNPSPPAMTAEEDELLKAEYIEDTLFSKSWVLRLMMKLCKYAENSDELIQASPCNGGNVKVQELDESMEHELCELWDMTMNKEVALFVLDQDGIDIILNSITKLMNFPRLTEICVGLLGNMVCVKEVQQKLKEQPSHIDTLISLLERDDAPTLHELTRLFHSCLTSETVGQIFVDAFDHGDVISQLMFLISTTRKRDLLQSLAELIDGYLDLSDTALESCLTETAIKQLCEAYHESHGKCTVAVSSILHCFQLLTTMEEGIKLLTSPLSDIPDECGNVLALLLRHLSLCNPTEHSIAKQDHAAAASCLSTLASLGQVLQADLMNSIRRDDRILGNTLKVIKIQSDELLRLSNGKDCNEDPSTREKARLMWRTYLAASISFLDCILETSVTEKSIPLPKQLKDRSCILEIQKLLLKAGEVLESQPELESAEKHLSILMRVNE